MTASTPMNLVSTTGRNSPTAQAAKKRPPEQPTAHAPPSPKSAKTDQSARRLTHSGSHNTMLLPPANHKLGDLEPLPCVTDSNLYADSDLDSDLDLDAQTPKPDNAQATLTWALAFARRIACSDPATILPPMITALQELTEYPEEPLTQQQSNELQQIKTQLSDMLQNQQFIMGDDLGREVYNQLDGQNNLLASPAEQVPALKCVEDKLVKALSAPPGSTSLFMINNGDLSILLEIGVSKEHTNSKDTTNPGSHLVTYTVYDPNALYRGNPNTGSNTVFYEYKKIIPTCTFVDKTPLSQFQLAGTQQPTTEQNHLLAKARGIISATTPVSYQPRNVGYKTEVTVTANRFTNPFANPKQLGQSLFTFFKNHTTEIAPERVPLRHPPKYVDATIQCVLTYMHQKISDLQIYHDLKEILLPQAVDTIIDADATSIKSCLLEHLQHTVPGDPTRLDFIDQVPEYTVADSGDQEIHTAYTHLLEEKVSPQIAMDRIATLTNAEIITFANATAAALDYRRGKNSQRNGLATTETCVTMKTQPYHNTRTDKVISVGSQRECEGAVTLSAESCPKSKVGAKATFDPNNLTSQLVGGTCTAMCMDYLRSFFIEYCALQAKGVAQPSAVTKALSKIGENGRYQSASQEDRNIQAYMNTIRTTTTGEKNDVHEAKMKALAQLFGFSITAADKSIPPFYMDDDKLDIESVASHIERAPDTVYVIRTLLEANNEKREEYGHTTALFKLCGNMYLYDPSSGLRQLANTRVLMRKLCGIHNKHDVPFARFYTIKPANDFENPEPLRLLTDQGRFAIKS